ncbi:hypothetical protein OE88DRAFT_1642633 [Heliocybe sulcata]|uniref:Uncharacterized protein n=1 Tax=Heliocybe sulcata TaxID=5364 RepID=A0A5C3NAT1_9AGAM|nr:hypothetical protein OE88DRAFT_1642633 [Heliocybe sulcata]
MSARSVRSPEISGDLTLVSSDFAVKLLPELLASRDYPATYSKCRATAPAWHDVMGPPEASGHALADSSSSGQAGCTASYIKNLVLNGCIWLLRRGDETRATRRNAGPRLFATTAYFVGPEYKGAPRDELELVWMRLLPVCPHEVDSTPVEAPCRLSAASTPNGDSSIRKLANLYWFKERLAFPVSCQSIQLQRLAATKIIGFHRTKPYEDLPLRRDWLLETRVKLSAGGALGRLQTVLAYERAWNVAGIHFILVEDKLLIRSSTAPVINERNVVCPHVHTLDLIVVDDLSILVAQGLHSTLVVVA